MDSQILLYSIALSFQITGSILFIAYSSSLCRISIIRSFAANSFIIKDGDTKKMVILKRLIITIMPLLPNIRRPISAE